MGSPILWSCSFAQPGLCCPKPPPLRSAGSPWDERLRPGIHRHLGSLPRHTPPGLHSPVGAQCHWAALPCPAWSLLCLPSSQGLYSPAQYSLRKPVHPKPVKPGIHRHTGSPLHWPAPFRHAKPTLQRPATSPQLKASTQRPCGTPPTVHLPQEGSKPS
jgi:hypothetical protein